MCDCENLIGTVRYNLFKGLGHNNTVGNDLVPIGFWLVGVLAEHQAHPGKLSGAGLTLPGKEDKSEG